MSFGTVHITRSTVIGARIGLCADQVIIDDGTEIDASGLGCAPGQGRGSRTSFNVVGNHCSLPGGSYGGVGGEGYSIDSDECPEPEAPYGFEQDLTYEGSGGQIF